MTRTHVGRGLTDASLAAPNLIGSGLNFVPNALKSGENGGRAFANVVNKSRQITTNLFKPWFKMKSLEGYPAKAGFVKKWKTLFGNVGKGVVNSGKWVANAAKYAMLSAPLTLATWAATPVVATAGAALTTTKGLTQSAAGIVTDSVNTLTKPFEQGIHDKGLSFTKVNTVPYSSYGDYVAAAESYKTEYKNNKIAKLEAKLAKLKGEKAPAPAPVAAPKISEETKAALGKEEAPAAVPHVAPETKPVAKKAPDYEVMEIGDGPAPKSEPKKKDDKKAPTDDEGSKKK